MKSTTYARFALLLPYLILLEAGGCLYLTSLMDIKENILAQINLLWLLLAIFWVVPYSIVAIYLLNWSRRKTIEEIQFAFTHAPVTMVVITLPVYLAIYIIASIYHGDFFQYLGLLILSEIVSVPANLLFGYIFIGAALLLYRLLHKLNFIQD